MEKLIEMERLLAQAQTDKMRLIEDQVITPATPTQLCSMFQINEWKISLWIIRVDPL